MRAQTVRVAVLLGLAVMLLVVQGAAQGRRVVSNRLIPFYQSVFVSNGSASEQVYFTGSIHLLVTVAIPSDPLIPSDPTRIHTNLMEVRGIGQTSGLNYNLTGAANFEFPAVEFPGSFSFIGSYRLIPGNPVRPDGNLTLPIRYNVSLNSIGEVTEVSARAGGTF